MNNIDHKMICEIALDLKKDIIQLREAEEIVPRRTDDFIVENSVMETIQLNQKFSEIGLTGLQVQINRVDYWRKILTAKLTLLNIIGGYELAEKICSQLAGYDKEIKQYNEMFSSQEQGNGNHQLQKKEYGFKKAFSLLADGIIEHWTQLV